MDGGAAERQALIAGLADQIAIELRPLSILAADVLLDEARRFTFTKVYSGFSDEKVRGSLGTHDRALPIAARLEGLSLGEAEQAIALVRRTLWPAHFATVPGTKFGREFAAYMEGAEHAEPSRKLN